MIDIISIGELFKKTLGLFGPDKQDTLNLFVENNLENPNALDAFVRKENNSNLVSYLGLVYSFILEINRQNEFILVQRNSIEEKSFEEHMKRRRVMKMKLENLLRNELLPNCARKIDEMKNNKELLELGRAKIESLIGALSLIKDSPNQSFIHDMGKELSALLSTIEYHLSKLVTARSRLQKVA